MFAVKNILLVLLVFTFPPTVNAEPSKNETYDFLNKKVSFNKKDSWGTNNKHSLSSSEDQCTLTYTSDIYPNNYHGNVQYTHQFTVDLKEVDPNEIKSYQSQGYHLIEFMVREDRNLIRNEETYSDYYMSKHPEDERVRSYNKSRGSMSAENRRDAEKSARALSHLVSLCGGKSELF